MDVDLSTDLDGLLPLVAPLLSGHSQVAIGSRIARGPRVLRGGKREFVSRSYNLTFAVCASARTSPMPSADSRRSVPGCGRGSCCRSVADTGWFFDTELLVIAELRGSGAFTRCPSTGSTTPYSRVKIGGVAWNDLRGVWRLAFQRVDVEPHGSQSPAIRRLGPSRGRSGAGPLRQCRRSQHRVAISPSS